MSSPHALSQPIFSYVLLKVASRCNINCTYCYWFRDKTVYAKPPLLTPETEQAFLQKLESHIQDHNLGQFTVLLHGGEPLLFGKPRFVHLMDRLDGIQRRTGCHLARAITTNGVLINEEWARLLRIFDVRVTISLDGPSTLHNANRVDFRGNGTYERVVRGIRFLRQQGIEPSVLAVCDPSGRPDDVCRHFVDRLGLQRFDIMVPDATHEDAPLSIASYYKELFDLWYDQYAQQGISIRYVESLVKAILGGNAESEAIGYGPIQLITVLTDGALEPLDVLRIAGNGSTRTNLSIHTHTFQDVTQDPTWREAFEASLNLPKTCQQCEYRMACGGGYLPHRWSTANRYDNPSVYCDDLKGIFGHIWEKVAPEIVVSFEEQQMSLAEAVEHLSE